MAPERKLWKVLFVDDEVGLRKVMEITLADAGYRVLTAADGETALSLCAKESPQITITDIRMPGMRISVIVICGDSCAQSDKAVSPSGAVSTWYPASAKVISITFRMPSSSSTKSTFHTFRSGAMVISLA